MVIWNDDAYLGTWKVAVSVCQFTSLEGRGGSTGRRTATAPGSGRLVRSAGRPCHRPTAQQVRVRVRDGLTALPPGVEHDPVAAAVDALGDRDLMRLADKLVEQAATRVRQCRHVRVMIPRDDQDVGGRLRVDVAEGDGPLSVKHDRGRDVAGRDRAKQTVRHTTIIVARRRYLVLDLAPGYPRTCPATMPRARGHRAVRCRWVPFGAEGSAAIPE
jgi:hypothetical protein